ncbi:metal ABC transporter ATP-binding protein [Thermogladius sp. 4427co]|uniref:metal ABC transporter ATP-binding protein n=1 Tax=Thermogladius sp. 4427co TaxID=3450718 RepID=UPI003F796710
MYILVEDVYVKRDSQVVLESMNIKFEGPGLIQVIGPNGAGKTTLFLTILGLLKPVKGRILLDGTDVTGRPELLKGKVGYMPQTFDIDLNTPFTVWELVDCCMRMYSKWPRILRGNKDAVKEALVKAGVDESLWHKKVSELSGGERQRVFLARALVSDPPILILDEPLANIDPHGRVLLAETIGSLSKEKLVIVSSHDPSLMLKYTSMILVLNKNIYVYGEPREVLTPEILRKIYGFGWELVEKRVQIYDFHT